MAGKNQPVEPRFWKNTIVKDENSCWPWIGNKSTRGYGVLSVEGKLKVATRISWEIKFKAPFPDGLFACHTCDNVWCVNPNHIWPGTTSDNAKDAYNKGRRVSPTLGQRKLFCPSGHPYNEKNTYVSPFGARQCRECTRIRRRKERRSKRCIK